MKYFTSDPGNLMPSARLTNPSDTVLESANDQASQQTGPMGTSWTCWQKQRLFRQEGSGKSLKARFLALGTASILATMMPVAADATIVSVANLPLDLLTKPFEIDGDGEADLSCEVNNYITANGWLTGNYVECMGVNGEVVSEDFVSCEPPNPDEEDNDPSLPDLQCPSGSTAPTGPKSLDLALKTSSDLNAWVRIVIDASIPLAQAESGAYSGQPIVIGQTGEEITKSIDDPVGTVRLDPSSGNVTWTPNSNNGTGFSIYRDGSLIGTTAANVTSIHDSSLPCALPKPVTYVVKAISNGSDYEVARGEVTIPNTCESNSAMLFVAIDGEGSGKVTTSPNTISCRTNDCHDDLKDSQGVPKCNPEKCATSVEIGKDVILTPVAESGSFFSNWGLCAGDKLEGKSDVKVTMTENNKQCIAFFQKSPPSGLKSRPPEEMPTLPSLGECMAFDSHGNKIETTAQISVEVLVNGTDSQPVVTAKPTDQIVIRANLRMDPQHQPALVDILVFGNHQETGQDTAVDWWMMDKDGTVSTWDNQPANLVSFRTGVPLTADKVTTLEIYRGTPPFNSGLVEAFLGYRLEDGKMVCGIKPVEINVK